MTATVQTERSQAGKNDYWHTAEDSLDKLSAESLEIVGRVVVRMVTALAQPAAVEK